MSGDKPPIGVIGVGWVGLVSASCFAELGHDVWCRDIDAGKVASLMKGEVPIYEAGLADLVEKNAARLHFESELAPVLEHARLLFVCVDTPPTYSGDADLSRVQAVIDELPDSAEHAIVMKSTVPVGTGASIRRRLAEQGKPSLGYVSNPEFLKEGSAVEDFMHPDRVVIGCEPESAWGADAVAALYEPLDGPIVRTDVASAEMIKLASNAFLSTKISFINEIANVCEEVGADVGEVARGMGLDPRIGPKFLNAGIGFGGSCLVGDETVLVREAERVRMVPLEQLFDELAHDSSDPSVQLAIPDGLEVLSWSDGADSPEFMPVAAATRRPFAGELLELHTEMGRQLRCTPDHPFVVGNSLGEGRQVKLAEELTDQDWLPIAPDAAVVALEPDDVDILYSLTTHQAHEPNAIAPATTQVLDDVVSGRTLRIEWVRVTTSRRLPFAGLVYSLEVPGSETFVTTGGLVVHNCFPKDVTALKQLAGNSGYHFQLLNAVIEVNELQKRRVVNKLKKHLGSLVGKQIALLGLAFKPHTDDMREATSVVLASRLQGEGARVRAYDPVAEDRAGELITGAEMCQSALDVLNGADAAVIVTEWPEFAELDLEEAKKRMNKPLIVDGRNLLSAEEVRAAGFVYEGIGRS